MHATSLRGGVSVARARPHMGSSVWRGRPAPANGQRVVIAQRLAPRIAKLLDFEPPAQRLKLDAAATPERELIDPSRVIAGKCVAHVY